MTTSPLTGRKVFAITAGFFGVIIGVNATLAYKAVSTFPGLEVANSYVASQHFDTDRAAQNGLGWALNVAATRKLVTLRFTGVDGSPVQPKQLQASIGRATEAVDDSLPAFAYDAGAFTAPVNLAPGKWVLRLEATAADGTLFRQRISLHVQD